MKNRERFKDEITRIATRGDRLACQDGVPVGCTEITCTTCDFRGEECWLKLREWAEKEYVPSDIDWALVPVDTPVVIYAADGQFVKAHICKASEEGVVVVFANGETSWTTNGLVRRAHPKNVDLARAEDRIKYRKEKDKCQMK